MLNFLHGSKRKNLDILVLIPTSVTKQNKITAELSPLIKKENIYSSDAEMVSSAIKQKSFLIALWDLSHSTQQKSVSMHFQWVNKGYF